MIEPIIYPAYGKSFVGREVSIVQFMLECLAHQALLQFDKPLTNYGYSDEEGRCAADSLCRLPIQAAQTLAPSLALSTR